MLPKEEDGFKIAINQQVTGATMADQQREMQHKMPSHFLKIVKKALILFLVMLPMHWRV